MSKELFSSVDTAWLRMETPTNLMTVNGVLILGARLDFQRFKATLECRLLDRFDRFRQRVIRPSSSIGPYYWEDDPHFDLDNHITRIALSPRSNLAALQDAVSDLMSVPLDFSRPLWQLYVIEKFGRGSAIIAQLHHCMADGIALMHVLFSLTDRSPDAPWPVAQPRPPRAPTDPLQLLDWPRLKSEAVQALARLVLRWPDPKTLLKGDLGIAKRVAWSEPISLQAVRDIRRLVNGTVNDVLLTAMTGALRNYLQERGESADGLSIRAVVPVNLRPLGIKPSLGNRFGLVFLELPVGVPDPLDRLRELKRDMDELKNSPEPAAILGLLGIASLVPAEIQNVVVDILGAKATAVMTNVPGPRAKLYLAGAPLDSFMFWVPQAGRLGLGVSILSYAGEVRIGVASDQGLIPDPEAIVAGFHDEFNILSRATRKKRSRRSKAARPMARAIDQSTRTVDALLEKKRPSATGCRARTRTGQMCKNRPLPGSHYCRVHQRE
jgi:diacylglycerol O-acyltransferase